MTSNEAMNEQGQCPLGKRFSADCRRPNQSATDLPESSDTVSGAKPLRLI